MPQTLIQLDLNSYPYLSSLVPTQTVKLELSCEVVKSREGNILLRIKSLTVAGKSKLSTQEILLQSMNDKLERIANEQSTAKPTP